MSLDFTRLLHPSSIAIVGASDNGFASRCLFENLRQAGFAGTVLPVNPRQREVEGIPALADIGAADRPDAVVILLNRGRVEEAVTDALKAGAGGIVVVSGGFRETNDPTWTRTEQRIADATRSAAVPLVGPNSMGVANFAGGAYMTIAPYPFSDRFAAVNRSGSVALVMQSGAQLLAAMRYLDFLGTGAKYAFSLGNSAAVSFADVVDVLAADDDIREIVFLIESIPNWKAFRATIEAATAAGKWVAATVVGLTERGRQAAMTHTGALTSNHDMVTTVLSQLGIRVGASLTDVISGAALHARFGEPGGGGVGIFGVSGGVAGLSSDLAGSLGIELPLLAEGTRKAIGAVNPDIPHPENPLDIAGGPLDPPAFGRAVNEFLADPGVGVGIYLPSWGLPDERAPGHQACLRETLRAAAAPGRRVVISQLVYAPVPEPAVDEIRRAPGVCFIPSLAEALAAISLWSAVEPSASAPPGRSAPGRDRHESQPFNEHELKKQLEACGVSAPKSRFLPVDSADVAGDDPMWEAVIAELGRPVVVKGSSRHVLHKAETQLVVLDVTSGAQLHAAIAEMSGRGVLLDGFLVEAQAEPGCDLLLGVFTDPLGTVVAMSSGGRDAGARDGTTWFGVDPTDTDLLGGARDLIASLGFAGIDVVPLCTAIRRTLAFFEASGLRMLELNPVRVRPAGAPLALDAVALERSEDDHD